VKRQLLGFTVGVVLTTAGLFAARAVEPGRSGLELHVYVLVLGGLAVLALAAALRAAAPLGERSAFDEALAPHELEASRPTELERLEREVVLGAARAFDTHYRLRPVVREIALQQLVAKRGIVLDAQPEAARQALGDETWDLVRADREPPSYHHASGPGLAAVERIVQRLERL
jgi:hypothetical protein